MEYAHLSQSERDLIQHLFNEENLSISEIAKKINRNKSTISRELKRNTSDYFYDVEAANKKALSRHRNKYFFHNLKYEEFSKLFLRYYDKRYMPRIIRSKLSIQILRCLLFVKCSI